MFSYASPSFLCFFSYLLDFLRIFALFTLITLSVLISAYSSAFARIVVSIPFFIFSLLALIMGLRILTLIQILSLTCTRYPIIQLLSLCFSSVPITRLFWLLGVQLYFGLCNLHLDTLLLSIHVTNDLNIIVGLHISFRYIPRVELQCHLSHTF